MSSETAFRECGWNQEKNDGVDSALGWELNQADEILPPWRMSLAWMLPDSTYSQFGPDDAFVHEQRGRGYAEIFEPAIASAKFRDPVSPTLKLDCEVVDVARASGAGPVAVSCRDGRRFCSRLGVISTLPLGVMQQTHSAIFKEPRLSDAQSRALNKIIMGNFTKIFGSWPTRFWRGRGPQWIAARPNNKTDVSATWTLTRVPPPLVRRHCVLIRLNGLTSRRLVFT